MSRIAAVLAWWRRLTPRRRRRCVVGLVAVVGFGMLAVGLHSLTAAAVSVAVGTGLLVAGVYAARVSGVSSQSPLVAWVVQRAWRSPERTYELACAGFKDTIVPTASGALAHQHLQVLLHPDTLNALMQRMSQVMLQTVTADVYRQLVADQHAAVTPRRGPVTVTLLGDPTVGRGRYRIGPAPAAAAVPDAPVTRMERNIGAPGAGQAAGAGRRQPATGVHPPTFDVHGPTEDRPAGTSATPRPVGQPKPSTLLWPLDPAGALDGETRADQGRDDRRDVVAPECPPGITLHTGALSSSTVRSPATAGRGADADLKLPDVDTISRVHAVLTRRGTRWWIEGLGRNGLFLNGTPVTTARELNDGDLLRWGTADTAPTSRVLLPAADPGHGGLRPPGVRSAARLHPSRERR